VSSINLTNIEGLSCFYKLEGIDEDWIQTNSNEPIRYPNLASGSYEFVAYFEDIDGGKSDAIRFQFTIQLPFWKRWWFILISAFTLIGITAFFITNRDKSQREKQQLSQRLVQSEIDGLKSQMNPHFIFNSLNSIQDLILMKDFKSSTIYLGKFSSLLRMTLEYSSKPKIYIKEEVELLSIYLELEALRFENGIQTKVEVQGDDIMQLTIPPLLIQPFVENALKHGLFQSQKAEKKLTVSFYKESDFLCCSIEDNGVGRKAAQAYNEKKLTNHNSYASKAIQKRVDLINQTLVTKIETKIIDLEEGTRVELRFPN
jgi:LytS/YehU family sensor histidine kinase